MQLLHAAGWTLHRRNAVPRTRTLSLRISGRQPRIPISPSRSSTSARVASALIQRVRHSTRVTRCLGFGKFGTLKTARASLASAEALETATRFRTTLETDAAYFAVLADKELSRVAADRLRRAEEQLAIARVRVIAGESVSSDSLRLLLEASRARLAILSMDSSLIASRLRLGRRIGLSGPAEAAPVDSVLPLQLPMTEEQAVAEMRARGPDVEAARAQEKSASAAILTARERYLPEINVGATLGRYDSQLFPDALKRNQWNMSIALPIWNGGTRELNVARAGRSEPSQVRRVRTSSAQQVK